MQSATMKVTRQVCLVNRGTVLVGTDSALLTKPQLQGGKLYVTTPITQAGLQFRNVMEIAE